MAALSDRDDSTVASSSMHRNNWPQCTDSFLLRGDDTLAMRSSDEVREPNTEQLENCSGSPITGALASPVAAEKPDLRRRRGVRPFLVHEKAGLKVYSKYRHIYAELEFQRPVKKSQNLTFLDLPTEIRLIMYEYAFVSDEPLELWAESGDVYKDQKLRRRNAAIMTRKIFNNRRGCVNLGFLRTCKQINIEGTEIFYGHNEFRFSGKNGHMAAFAFVTKIGPRNLSFMKSITMALPIESYNEGMYGENWNPTNWRRIHEVYDRMPFPYSPKPWRYRKQYMRLTYGDAWYDLAQKLATAQRLKTIAFVMPDTFRFRSSKAMSAFMHLFKAKPFLKLQIVRMIRDEEDAADLPESNAQWVKRLFDLGTSCMQSAVSQIDGRWSLVGQPYVNMHHRSASFEDVEWTEANTEVIKDIRRLFD